MRNDGDEHPGRNGSLWLLEWSGRTGAATAGQTALAPATAVLVNQAIGGWSYGQWEVPSVAFAWCPTGHFLRVRFWHALQYA